MEEQRKYTWDDTGWADAFKGAKPGTRAPSQIVRDPGKRILCANKASQLLLKPIKYEWAWKHYKVATENFWTFGEINFSYDIAQIKQLDEPDRNLLEQVVSYFAVQESLIQDEVAMGLYPHLTNPEIRMYLHAQGHIEAIHAETYDGLIGLLGLDVEKAYYAYQDDPFIRAKTEWAHTRLDALTDRDFNIDINNEEHIRHLLLNIGAFALVDPFY